MSSEYKYIISKDGELYHFKYFKREKIAGKWKYWYKKVTNKVKKTAKKTSSGLKNLFDGNTSKDEKSGNKKSSTLKSFAARQKKKFKYIKKELCFVFRAVPGDRSSDTEETAESAVLDSLYSVQKDSGELSLFTPFDISEEEYAGGTEVDIDSLSKTNNTYEKKIDTARAWARRVGLEN